MPRVMRYQNQPGTTLSIAHTSANQLAIATATVCNDSTATGAALTVHVVPSGGTVGDTNIIYNELMIPAGESIGLSMLQGVPLKVGDAIHMKASVADQLTVSISTDDNV